MFEGTLTAVVTIGASLLAVGLTASSFRSALRIMGHDGSAPT
jgi:hypothetical protein